MHGGYPAGMRASIFLPRGRRWLVLGMALGASAAWAGGHYDVDDADTLDAGHCQYEGWGGRGPQGSPAFQHLGLACRIGVAELGLNADRSASPDARVWGPALKWRWLGDAEQPLRSAVAFSAGRNERTGGKPSRQLLFPLTWQPLNSLMLHANLGADWAGGAARTARRGLAAEWAVDEKVSLVLERNRASGAWTSRGGLRFTLTPALTLDLSAARARPGGSIYTVGLSQEFSR